ncbi:LAMI_0H13630g1_1 [Lachancea mirantina]|uniref:LAMI_0H13630g1_1 n=1 Tax=Lachancea mirantina TaxID=1230905 RepID=A0A1G4KI04_9SACH|nr:LAMI_0H13630g1_1 [Lachancea mirantina]
MIHQMAPWVPQFIQSCKNHTQAFTPFYFATLDTQTSRPRCRTVVFRDFLFHDKRNNVLTFTTDMRGDKVKEITETGSITAPFEACFYFPSTWEQYRFSGHCFVVSRNSVPPLSETYNDTAPDTVGYPILSPGVYGDAQEPHHHESIVSDEDNDNDQNASRLRSALSRTSTRSSAGSETHAMLTPEDYRPPTVREWQQELSRQWIDVSRSTKAQFRKPDPGTPITSETTRQLDKIQRGVDGANEDAGFDNFGLVCLCVDEVDYLNLKDGRGGERWKFHRHTEPDTGLDTWEEEEVCP